MGRSRVRELKNVANQGPIYIIFETLNIYWSHAKFFLIIHLTFVLPILVLNVFEQFIFAFHSGSKIPPASPSSIAPGPAGAGSAAGHVLLPTRHHIHVRANPSLAAISALQTLGFTTVTGVVDQALQAVWICAVLYAVGLIYTDNSVSFLDVLHKIPHLWKRVLVTLLWQFSFAVCIVFLEIIFGIGMIQVLGRYSVWPFILVLLVVFGVLVGLLIVGGIADSVCVLDESYGWAALKKSWQLLKGNRSWVALGMTFFWGIMETPMSFLMIRIKAQYSLDPWNPLMWLESIVYAVCLSLVRELSCVSCGVMYASFKAYHGERIGDSSFFTDMVTKDIDEHHHSLLSGSETEP